MTARKPATKKPAAKKPAARSTRPSPAARIDELEQQVAALKTQVDNIAKFIAAGIAQQLQTQLMGSADLQAQLATIAAAQQAGGS